jgi:hypothetical protein
MIRHPRAKAAPQHFAAGPLLVFPPPDYGGTPARSYLPVAPLVSAQANSVKS